MTQHPIQRLLLTQMPAGVQVQLEERAHRSPVNMLLELAEDVMRRAGGLPPRLRHVWIQGGGCDATYLLHGEEGFIAQGDLDLRLRSAMRAVFTWDRDLADHPDHAAALSARIAAEMLRYGDQRMLASLLTNPYVRPMEIATVSTLEVVPIGIPYLAQWAIAIAHEAGHLWADTGMDQSHFAAGAPLQQIFIDVCRRAGDESLATRRLFHEATADAFCAEIWWAYVDLMRMYMGVQLAESDLRLEQKQTVHELVLHYRILSWLQEIRSSLSGATVEHRRRDRRDLHVRELMTIEQFLFNRTRDDTTLLDPDEIRTQWANDIRELHEERDFLEAAVAVPKLCGPAEQCASVELRHRLEWFYLDTAPPTSTEITSLIEDCDAAPSYYQPSPVTSWWPTV